MTAECSPGNAALVTRRRFIKLGALLTATHLSPFTLARTAVEPERRLSFYQTHTGEALDAVYWVQGEYVPDVLSQVDYLLRDHRSGEVIRMDVGLLDLLNAISRVLDTNQPFHVVSGYRSPKTNEMLAARGRGVASHSLHMDGMAIDIRVPGCDLLSLRDCAVFLQAGGVGYYPRSEFVHVDTGRVRTW